MDKRHPRRQVQTHSGPGALHDKAWRQGPGARLEDETPCGGMGRRVPQGTLLQAHHRPHGLCHLRLRRPARRPAPCRPSVPRGLPLDSCSPRHSIRTRAACGGKHRHRTHRCLPPGLRAGGRVSARNHRSGTRHGLQGFRPCQPRFLRP